MITDEEFRQNGCHVDNIYGGNKIGLEWIRDDQDWRSFRLHRVVGYLRAVADSTKDYALLRKISCIRDHKGDMTVFWHELPTDDEKSALEKAWNSEAESGDMIEHELEETNVLQQNDQ